MTYSEALYVGNGVTVDYGVTFDYLDQSHVYVSVDKEITTAVGSEYKFEFINSSTVRVRTVVNENPVPSGLEVRVFRQTPIDEPAVVFGGGASLSSANLNKNSEYLTFALQEAADANQEFTKVYLGAFAVEPTSDNEGETLRVGSVYFDTSVSALFYWSGTAWIIGESVTVSSANAADAAASAAVAVTQAGIATTQAAEAEASASRVDLGALDDAVAATAADVVLTNADVVLTNADVVLTNADVVTSTGLLADTTAARDLTETYAGVVSQSTSVAGLTDPTTLIIGNDGLVSGSGDDAIDGLYEVYDNAGINAWQRVGGTGLITVRTDVEPYDPALTYFPAPAHSWPIASSNAAFGSDFRWARTTGTASIILPIALTAEQIAWTTIEVRLPASGTFSTVPFTQLRSASGQIGADVASTFDSVTNEYVMSVTVSGAPVSVWVRWSTTSDGKSGFPYAIEGGMGLEKADLTLGKTDALTLAWHKELFARSGNILGLLPPTFEAAVGAPATVGADGKTVDGLTDTVSFVRLPVFGMFDGTGYYAALLRMHEPQTTFRSIDIKAGDFQGGNQTSGSKLFQNGEYFVGLIKAQDALAQPAQEIEIRIDLRASGLIPATAAKLEFIGAFNLPDETWVGRILADPVKLTERLAAWQQTPAWVNSDGVGERIYADLPSAVRAGHEVIYCGENQRLTDGLLLTGERTIYMSNGAYIRFSEALDISGFTTTAANANVYYRAATSDPLAVFEVDGDSIARMEVSKPTGTELYTHTASEAAVRATAGTAWYGAGSEGTGNYIRPFADLTAGKTYEVPVSKNGLYVAHGASTKIVQDADAVSGFSINRAAKVGGRLMLEGGTWGYLGQNANVIEPIPASNAVTELRNGTIKEAGNDGYNSGPDAGYSNTLILENTLFTQNWNDGIATGHSTGRDKVFMSGHVEASGNGKQGFVTIGLTDIDAANFVSRGNRDAGLFYLHSKAGDQSVSIGFADIDTLYINHTGSAAATGRIVGIVDTITNAGGLTVVRVSTV